MYRNKLRIGIFKKLQFERVHERNYRLKEGNCFEFFLGGDVQR